MQGVAQDLSAIDSERVGPRLDRGGVFIGNPEAEHRHTVNRIAYDAT